MGAEVMTTDTTSTATTPEPWWKKAPQAPPPRWASPAAVERLKQQLAGQGAA